MTTTKGWEDLVAAFVSEWSQSGYFDLLTGMGQEAPDILKAFISSLLLAQKNELRGVVRELTVPECEPRNNSEYHLGFNEARYAYAEEKIKLLAALDV